MELESEWNEELRWIFLQHGRRCEIFRHQCFDRGLLFIANVMGRRGLLGLGNLHAFLAGNNAVELNGHRRSALVAVCVIREADHACHAR